MSSVMYMVDKGGLDTTSAYPYLGRVRGEGQGGEGRGRRGEGEAIYVN